MHVPVLLKEVLENLNVGANDIFVDATLGNGGHSIEISKLLSDRGILIGIDLDKDSLSRASETLKKAKCKKYFLQANFRNLDKTLDSIQIGKVDKILFDLGWNMDQFADGARGFSFQVDGPLDMRLATDPDQSAITARDIVNDWAEESIVDILEGYGEEKRARKIAKAIVIARSEKEINSTLELAEIIAGAVGRRGKIHPATKTFQALRIAVNDEIGALREGLTAGLTRLKEGGRIGVITFHSIEDRVVKRFFKDNSALGKIVLVNKKPIVPERAEILINRRARSAKLRVIEKKHYE